MFTATISAIDKPDSPLYQESFDTEGKAKDWLVYQIPSLSIDKLKPNSKLNHADVYSVSLTTKTELPEAEDEPKRAVKAKPEV